MKTRPYIVRQGDYLTKLAALMDFDAEAVWNDASNRELRGKRTNPNILHPGDVLQIPEDAEPSGASLTAGAAHRFRARRLTAEVKLLLRDFEDVPLSNQPYRLEGIGPTPLRGVTDAAGNVRFEVPLNLDRVRLVLEGTGREMWIRVGHLDPVEEMSGVAKRLEHLGYLRTAPFVSDEGRARLARAIRTFQDDVGLEATGEADDATREALVQRHKS